MVLNFKAKEIDNNIERLICTSLITSDQAIKALAPIIDSQLMTAKATKCVVDWCLDYFKSFGNAPKSHIQDLFERRKKANLDEDTADLIESFLDGLNNEMAGEQFNINYAIDQAEKYIRECKAQSLCNDIQALIDKGHILEAEEKITTYVAPKKVTALGQDIFSSEFWKETDEEAEKLFQLPGALNDLVGPIERDSFISILAPEKRGKTWFLLYFALTAFRQRCNVAFFSCGDMTIPQMRKRIRHMLTSKDPKRQKASIIMPVLDCYHNQMGDCPLGEDTDAILKGRGKMQKLGTFEEFPDHIICSKCHKNKADKDKFCGAVWYEDTAIEAIEKPLDAACKAILQRAGNKNFRLFCYPPAELTVAQISAQLDILEQQENFTPDVVVIDYADLLDVEAHARRLEYRHQINATWMSLRALSQVKRCALITATQAKIEARKKTQVDQWDTSEDKRKLAHVTAMLALNQTPAEKRQGIMRISNIAMRDADFDVEKNVTVLQCLAAGKPCITSYIQKKVKQEKKEDSDND